MIDPLGSSQALIGSAQVLIVGDVVRLAVAPVFLLSGVGVMLTVLTNRLARAVDRARLIEAREHSAPENELAEMRATLAVIARRASLLSYAITLSTICALLVSLVVVTLFLGAFFKFDISLAVATLFIVAMLSFIAGLLLFLREIFLATRALRFGFTRRPRGA
ncbi:MAG: DUF2721 domain-containing protein [Steroidobacterales bacterium]